MSATLRCDHLALSVTWWHLAPRCERAFALGLPACLSRKRRRRLWEREGRPGNSRPAGTSGGENTGLQTYDAGL